MTTIIYDIEIAKAIPDRKAPPEPGIAYCEGWHDHAGMGIACIAAYVYEQARYRVFCQDNKAEFDALCQQATCIAGFNNIGFDNKVLAAAWGITFPPAKDYDLLQEVWAAHGLPPVFNFRTHGGFGLDALAAANGFPPKSGNGALAPVDWQRGKIASVIDYCINDVLITKRLIDKVRETGTLMCPKFARPLTIRPPKSE